MTARAAAMPLFVVLSLVGTSAQSQPSSDPWFRLSAKPKDFVAARLPWNTFTIDLPKAWTVAPGYAGILLSAIEKPKGNLSAASIVLEQTRLTVPLTMNEIDAGLAKVMADDAQVRDPAGQNFQSEMKNVDSRRFVIVSYSRSGLNGTDAVLRYAFPSGDIMYHLVCIAPAAQMIPKYQATFAHVAATFKPVSSGAN